jgi:DNA adenine methylase
MSYLKWMGGKSKVIHLFQKYFPNISNTKGYIEPFVGGCNVFFFIKQNYDLTDKPVYLSDINGELVNCHKMVRDNVKDIIPLLKIHEKLNGKKGEEYYYEIRNKYPPGRGMSDVEKASAFIYLCNVAFGGMWRVNSDGKMNASYSGNTDWKAVDEIELRYYSGLLKGVKIVHSSFENILKINGGDLKDWFCYQDPPYDDVGNNPSVSKGYSKDGYHISMRYMLPRVFKQLNEKGCKVMMSNANVPTIRESFKDYNIHTIETQRKKGVGLDNITKDIIEDAKKLSEVVITNYPYVKRQLTMDDYR